jgi:dTDP-4-dehydrorhamnose reductase
MRLLLLGSTGLLGQAAKLEGMRRGWTVYGAARSGAELALDISDDSALASTLATVAPEVVVNCAALVDIQRCEEDPSLAYCVNARPVAHLAAWSQQTGRRLVHISTDHFFVEGGARPHTENDPIAFANEYARSKFAGEAFALVARRALVLRTSIVGIRGWGTASFAEWVIKAVVGQVPVTAFADAYTSSIDVQSFAAAAFDFIDLPVYGLLNLASSEVYSKKDFVLEMARQLDREVDILDALVRCQKPPRAASLGLDVSRAEKYLGRPLPGLKLVVAAVIKQFKERSAR